jgi:alginate O-acetyltransferase complex protein AlgI
MGGWLRSHEHSRFDESLKILILQQSKFSIRMLFNSLLFIFWFLPVLLLLYFITPARLKNPVLLLAGIVFYAWGGVFNTLILVGSIVVNYLAGLLIDRSFSEIRRKRWLVTGIIINLLVLAVFKYTLFITENINVLTSIFGFDPILINNLLLPMGVSFYTFKAITYLVSVKRRETPVQKNPVDLALYISIFPEVLAGPIDRYKTLSVQIASRRVTMPGFISGIQRFALGLLKKVIISAPLAVVADRIFSLPPQEMSTPMAWFGAFCYSLQIYFDFSGYSDMAIGLGRMFGFTFMENFNFPYMSRTVKEFWRRWHISLSTWLRDYLFLPISMVISRRLVHDRYLGVRVDHVIYITGITVTFLLCGLWHGPAWHYVAWGLIHGIFLSLERTKLGKWLDRGFKPIGHLYLAVVVMVSMSFFRAGTLTYAVGFTGVMFGMAGQPVVWKLFSEFFTREFTLVLILAVLASTPLFLNILTRFRELEGKTSARLSGVLIHAFEIGKVLAVLVILTYSTLQLLSRTNMPFIYFQF